MTNVFTLPRSGVDTFLLYGNETTYGTAGTTDQVFGLVQSVTPTSKRNLIQVRGFVGTTESGRQAKKVLGAKFETSISIEFQPQHFDWLKYVLGTRTGAGTAASKYVYASTVSGTTDSTSASKLADSTASFDTDTLVGQRVINTTDGTATTITAVDSGTALSVAGDIFTTGEAYTILADSLTSMTIATNHELGTTDRLWKYLGMKVNSCTIKSALAEPVSVTLELIGADVDQATALANPVALDTAEPYHFVGSGIEWPNSSSISNIIDSFEITITNNVEILYGLGSYVGKNAKAKAREYSLKMSLKTYDNTFSDDFLGNATDVSTPTEVATVEFNMAGGTNHIAAFLFTGVTLDEWASPETLAEVVPEEMSGVARQLSVTEQQTT